MGKIWGLAAAAALTVAAPPDKADVMQLAWLSGNWVAEYGAEWTQESWTEPRGGMMLGTGSSGRGDAVADWEHMRIAPDEAGVLSFWGSPKSAPAIAFRLVALSPTEAVFENPKHDYPVRIGYRREGEVLVASISGANGANPMRWRYRRR